MLKEILQRNKFWFNKSLGQNFISDKNLLDAIVIDGNITKDDIVVEIGTGAGTLTRSLCEKAKKVVTFEVDTRLQPIIEEVLQGYTNYEVHFEDVLKMSDEQLLPIVGNSFKVVANLPYYITTPLIMRFVESSLLKVSSLTFMIQKEVAERLCAKANTPEYGAITLAVRLRGDSKITRIVDKKAFYPVPKVDSAIVHIEMNDKYGKKEDKQLQKLIKSAFLMRRKTLLNNLIASFSLSRDTAQSLLEGLGYDSRIRGEALTIEDFIKISDKI